ncbi:hypothetical protein CPC08DRAFT_755086 [Agrocybe pediades]|nr:hypothetical protein CPC08DRAFT_755086 [Agrocybe pediades]
MRMRLFSCVVDASLVGFASATKRCLGIPNENERNFSSRSHAMENTGVEWGRHKKSAIEQQGRADTGNNLFPGYGALKKSQTAILTSSLKTMFNFGTDAPVQSQVMTFIHASNEVTATDGTPRRSCHGQPDAVKFLARTGYRFKADIATT